MTRIATRVPVVRGENVWRLLRTDRDGATEQEVLRMVGPAMHHMLHEAGEQFADIDPWQIVVQTTPEGQPLNEWRIGAARPIVAVRAARGRMPPFGIPAASRVLGTRARTEGPTLPQVAGERPWWILVRFWWRQNDTSVRFPGYRVDPVGWHTVDWDNMDWLLDKAIVPLVATADPGAETFGEVVTPPVLETVKKAARVGGTAVAVLAGIALLIYLGPSLLAAGRSRAAAGRRAAA